MPQLVKLQQRSNCLPENGLTKVSCRTTSRRSLATRTASRAFDLPSARLSVIKRFSVWGSNEIQKSDKTHHCFTFWVGALFVVSSVKFAFPVVSSNDCTYSSFSIQYLLLFTQPLSQHEDCRLCSVGRWCRIRFCLEPLQGGVLIEGCNSW